MSTPVTEVVTGAGGPRKAVSERAQHLRLVVASGLIMASTVTWRQGDYYSGGVDPTVVAKGLLGILAAVVAYLALRDAPQRRHVRLSVPVYLVAYGAISLMGAWATGALLVASGVLLARLGLLAFTVFCLVRVFEPLDVLRTFGFWLAGVTAVAALTGTTAGSLRSGADRLIGGIPPLLPNEIAQLCGLCVLLLLWHDLNRRARARDGAALLGLLAVLWLSGSRTTLVFLVVGVALLVVQSRRLGTGVVVVVLALVPVAFYLGFGTNVAQNYLERGGSANIGSLSQRTVAWSAALHLHHGFWQVAFGNGLARTSIPVVAKYRTSQILDSTWISALVQTGLIGLVVLACWALQTVRNVWRTPGDLRSLYLALAVLVLGLSFLESGTIGASALFVVYLVLGLTAGPPQDVAATPPALHVIFARRPVARKVSKVAPV
ncbi:hypothetical protein [Jatrophihabitans endophyticus]|uniref:hypothetical protein n=1 Tax=Jatrophihabitans endophyticus TaxID=1206085 RepID=UPI0019FBDE62|nr:hypothetical protein [Jatrophihabitans endophyticus]MBE7189468.1 hypothetical protein [Jatrophihabitans endophyticus]